MTRATVLDFADKGVRVNAITLEFCLGARWCKCRAGGVGVITLPCDVAVGIESIFEVR